MTLLEAAAVSRRFRPGRMALDAVSLKVERGGFVALTGPSGGGKTTLLSLLGALDVPSEGRVLFDGEDLAGLAEAGRARARRRIGIVFQQSHMIPRLPVWENVTYPLLPRGTPTSERWKIARRWLERMGLEDRMDAAPEELSGGERRRVGVARALAGEPEVLLADEPTGDLDADTAAIVRELFGEFRAGDGTVVLATHDPAADAADAADARVLRLEGGRLAP